ncbi:kinase-like protein, partial [Wolfiporia cocos MD-104 SS10]
MVQFSAILPSFLGVVLTSGDMRLRMLEVLGHGAYGVVYLAQDLNYSSSQPKYYAVKCLLKQPEDSEHYRLQQREISYHKAASSLPNVVRLHQVIEDDFYMYLVLDYCPGGDLFSAIIDRGVFIDHNERLRRTFLQLLDAVHDCHDIGIYHRDLKPENIMCSADGEDIYLCDFGLATRHKLSVNFGCGSSFYMSPECIGDCTGRKPFVTSISDIWSLGIILTNLITSRNPWHVASPSEDVAFAAYLQQGETWLRRMLPISRGACSILARIFVIEPERRITLHELRNAIKELNSFF